MNLDNDIDPGAHYMDRKRCFSIYFYTFSDCGGGDTDGVECCNINECRKQCFKLHFYTATQEWDCHHCTKLKECEKQNER